MHLATYYKVMPTLQPCRIKGALFHTGTGFGFNFIGSGVNAKAGGLVPLRLPCLTRDRRSDSGRKTRRSHLSRWLRLTVSRVFIPSGGGGGRSGRGEGIGGAGGGVAMAEKKRFSDVLILSNAILVSGVTAFILGVIAENAKPTEASLAPVVIGNVHVCSYPKDSSPALGTAGLVFLVVSLFLSLVALVYPYDQKSVPVRALLKSKSLVFFSVLSVALSLTAAGLLLWATVAEATRRKFHVVDASTVSSCPTAKPGLFGAAAFLALDATLFWLVVVMLTVNARNNFLQGDDDKGVYGELAVRYSGTAQLPAAASNV